MYILNERFIAVIMSYNNVTTSKKKNTLFRNMNYLFFQCRIIKKKKKWSNFAVVSRTKQDPCHAFVCTYVLHVIDDAS